MLLHTLNKSRNSCFILVIIINYMVIPFLSVSFSRVEPIVEGYFIIKNYVVQRNVPFLKSNRKWSDIDIIAFNDRELYLVECKRGSLDGHDKAMKLIEHFKEAEEYIRRTSPYKELIDRLGLNIKKLYVAEYIRKEKDELENNSIEVRNVGDVIKEISNIIKELVINKKIEGAFGNPFLRYMVLLCKTKLLSTCVKR